MGFYIGLMSGTSLDGIDAVLVDLAEGGKTLTVLAHSHAPFAPELRSELLALNAPGDNELHRAALAANALALACEERIEAVLGGTSRAQVRAIGAHGQTVRHRPGAFDGIGYTCQLLNGALLAERCGIDVVCDFRSRDVAANGQGAPLVPAFHAALFAQPDMATAVLNLGGIANLTLLPAEGPVLGFDCGPANALLDGWCERHTGQPYDEGGRWAASGRVDEALLAQWLAEPYFARRPPKSTGRDLFSLDWLDPQTLTSRDAADVQATLAELTARSVAADLVRHAPASRQLWVCGGGAHNTHVMQRLTALLPGIRIRLTDEAGLQVTQVEAAAFAWLAQAFLEKRPGNLPEVTGAQGPRVLGALYPAR
ncbi:anhydro-N-acetylmuramic acid kinase [Aquincola sp. MAHUQ-54]|uniref:Anhydro-N-acetylmuramic acid kinase n=1 Tax=Aquincola agrisoli TaxID=3119538 RepID=A0AAW9QCT3_9BURK